MIPGDPLVRHLGEFKDTELIDTLKLDAHLKQGTSPNGVLPLWQVDGFFMGNSHQISHIEV